MRKTALITGATGRAGRIVAIRLARQGYRLILPCRDMDRAEALRSHVRVQVPGAEMDFVPCDMADLDSVRRCGTIIAERHPVIDLFVAGAATFDTEYARVSRQPGRTLVVNCLSQLVLLSWLFAHFYVHSRIVFVVSAGAYRCRRGSAWDPLANPGRTTGLAAYAGSQRGLLALARYFAPLCRQRQIACNSLVSGRALWWSVARVALPLRPFLTPHLRGGDTEREAEGILHLARAPDYNEITGTILGPDRTLAAPGDLDEAWVRTFWQYAVDQCRPFMSDEFLRYSAGGSEREVV